MLNKDVKKTSKIAKNRLFHLSVGLFCLAIAFAGGIFAIFFSPKESGAVAGTNLLFTPFGGKVEYWTPQSTDLGCSAITTAISVATLGSVNVTFEELKIGKPKPASVGIVKINGIKIPGLHHIYDYGRYQLPGVNVVGNSLDICNVCSKTAFEKIPLVKNVCKTKGVDKIVDKACKAASEVCSPLTNLLYSIGTSRSPSL